MLFSTLTYSFPVLRIVLERGIYMPLDRARIPSRRMGSTCWGLPAGADNIKSKTTVDNL